MFMVVKYFGSIYNRTLLCCKYTARTLNAFVLECCRWSQATKTVLLPVWGGGGLAIFVAAVSSWSRHVKTRKKRKPVHTQVVAPLPQLYDFRPRGFAIELL